MGTDEVHWGLGKGSAGPERWPTGVYKDSRVHDGVDICNGKLVHCTSQHILTRSSRRPLSHYQANIDALLLLSFQGSSSVHSPATAA